MTSPLNEPNAGASWNWLYVLGPLAIVPCAYGFITKYLKFLSIFKDSEYGAFVVMPVVNYTLAALGFSMLMVWAATQGMFRDVEQPKYDLLERERRLDSPNG